MRRVVILVVSGLLLGALLTGLAGALPGSQDLNALTWLGTVSTVAALVVAVGIFRVQQSQSDAAHQELLDALKAQDEILQDLTDSGSASDSPEPVPTPTPEPAPAPAAQPAPAPTAADADDGLTPAQREVVRERYGDRSISPWRGGGKAGRRGGARLVSLDDDTLLTVYTDGHGDTHVREINRDRRRGRPPRGPGSRGPGTA